MDRYAIIVDAGYFYAAGFTAIESPNLHRANVRLTDPRKLLENLKQKAEDLADANNLLRVYWYDAPISGGMTPDQAELSRLPSLKLRLGVMNGHGQQKGVDSLIVTDLVELARQRAISDAIVISGDEDIRVGVAIAQSYGVRVHVLGIGDTQKNMSNGLRQEADTVAELNAQWFEHVFTRLENTENQYIEVPAESVPDPWKSIVDNLLANRDRAELTGIVALIESSGGIPAEYDRPFIGALGKFEKRRLSPEELAEARKIFRERLAELILLKSAE